MNQIQPPQDRPLLNKVFLSPDEPRPRAGWRLLLQTVFMVSIAVCLGILLFPALVLLDPTLLSSLANLPPQVLVLGMFVEAVAVTVSIFLARRFLDRRSIESLGLRFNTQALFDFLCGILITLVQMGLIYLLMFLLGWITFEGFAWQFDPIRRVITQSLLYLALFILVAWREELLSRGYHLQTIASGLNLFWGVFLSSVIFGFLHLGNPGANWASTLGIFLAGLFFAYGYLRTRQLWLPIGMHLGWNFFEGVVFGFPVSGLEIYPLTRIQVTGPVLWTGGAFGPEAGLIVLPAFIVGVLLVQLYSRGRTEETSGGISD